VLDLIDFDSDGLDDGFADGTPDGTLLEMKEGCSDGLGDSSPYDGPSDGTILGINESCSDETSLGTELGAPLG
jgi:hypothetical protein